MDLDASGEQSGIDTSTSYSKVGLLRPANKLLLNCGSAPQIGQNVPKYFPDYSRRSHATGKESRQFNRAACAVTLDFEGMWAGCAAAGGAGCGTKKTRKRRRRREAKEQREAMQQAQLAGELDGRRAAAGASAEQQQRATTSNRRRAAA